MEIRYPKYRCNSCHKNLYEEEDFFAIMKVVNFSFPEDVAILKQGGRIMRGFIPGTQIHMHFCEACFQKLQKEK